MNLPPRERFDWDAMDDEFPSNEERLAAAIADEEVAKAARRALFTSLTSISGDDRLALDRLIAERHGLSPEDVTELLMYFEKNKKSGFRL